MAEKRVALVIGINDYPWQPLTACVNDAAEIAATLSMQEYGFEVKQVVDSYADRRSLLRELDSFFRATADTYLLYFSGHALSNELGAFLCPADIDSEPEGIGLDLITKYIERVVPRQARVVLVLDCCHAGAAKLGQSVSTSQPLVARNLSDAVPSLSKGRVLFAACCEDEAAFADRDSSHSLFTSFILRGLLSEASDAEGQITVGGLYDFVSAACGKSGLQTPVFKGEIAGSFVLARNLPPGVRRELSDDKIASIEEEAERHLAAYQEQVSVSSSDLGKWKIQGHRSACQTLDPLLVWFDEAKVKFPTLMSRREFQSSANSALQRLATLSALEEGIVNEKGILTEKLGSGLFGTVWKIESAELPRPLAYKVYHPQDLHIGDKMRRFERGYRAMRQLDHPYIVKVHDYTNCPRGFYMDYIHGPNLRDFVGMKVPVEERVSLLTIIADTLRHSHSRKVCHRDVKPENILITFDEQTSQWRPYLSDFDLAWFPTGSQLFTKTAMGSLYYAAPEQITKPTSPAAHDYRVDLFSFGQLAYFIATESDPGPMGVGDHGKLLEEKLRDGWNAEAATLFFGLFTKCTQQKPNKRPDDFSEVSDTVYKIAQSFRLMSSGKPLPTEAFIKELVFAIAGLDHSIGAAPDSLISRSGKTQVSLHVRRDSEGFVDFQYEFHSLVDPIVDGTSGFEGVRRVLGGRIDKVLHGFSLARKRVGPAMPFQVFVDHDKVPVTKEGLLLCRRLLTKVIEIIEGK
jgi:serine/threonine protein kinase